MELLIGGAAAVCAGFFTNPLEVIKVRFQLQGELRAKGQHVVIYKNVFNAAYLIATHDGLIALQKGLAPALWVQFIMNGTRLGIYEHFSSQGFTRSLNGDTEFSRSVFLSGIAGVCGHVLATPLQLVKTRIMAQSAKCIAVGYQHVEEETWEGLRRIFIKYGVRGLYRGAVAAVPRSFVASSSQLVSFHYCKEWLDTFEGLRDKHLLKSLAGSMVGGVVISIAVTPLDLILTRLYNQGVVNGRGALYSGYKDCVLKIYRVEGIGAFFKGLGPMYFRLGPHTLLTLTFWDKFKELHEFYVR